MKVILMFTMSIPFIYLFIWFLRYRFCLSMY